MKFFTNINQVSSKHADADLTDLIKLLKTNRFDYKSVTDHKNAQDFLFVYQKEKKKIPFLLDKTGITLTNRVEKDEQCGFIPSIYKNIPIQDNGYSYVFIDLDIKKHPDLTSEQHINYTDLLFDNYQYPSQDDKDFRKGLIMIRKSSSLKGLNLLFRVKGTSNKEDIKGYSIEILRRMMDQLSVNIFVRHIVNGRSELAVVDSSGWGSDRKMYFNYSEPDNYWINDKFEFLELDGKSIRENINWFGRKGPSYAQPINPKKSIEDIWNMSGGKQFEEVYVSGGNHERIRILCSLSTLYNISQDDLISWLEKEKPKIIDSSDPYSESETTRVKIKRLWKYNKVGDKIGFQTNASSLFLGTKVNKEVLYNKLKNSNLVILRSYESINRRRDFYFDNDGKLSRANFDKIETLMDSQWFRDFLFENKVSTEIDKAMILKESEAYIFKNGDFKEVNMKTDLVTDTEDTSYLYVAEGIVEIKRGQKPNLILGGSYLSDWESREIVAGGIKGDIISYNPSLKLEDWKELEFFNTCTDLPPTLKKTIGYQAYRFKQSNKIVNYIDGFESSNANEDDSGSGGGTGKTLVCYVLKAFRNVCEIGSPDPTNRFWLDRVRPDHDILLLNEVPEGFDIKYLRNFEDLNVSKEQKGIGLELLSGDACPRVLMNTNFPIIGTDKATKRRFISIPFNNKWQDISMMDTFGHEWFRSKHDHTWWSYMLLFVIDCIQTYLDDPTLTTALTDAMIYEKRNIKSMSKDDNYPYYEMIWSKLAAHNKVSVNDEIVSINKEHRVKLSQQKVHDYLRSKLSEHSKAERKFFELERKKDWKTGRNTLELKEKLIGFESLFEGDVAYNKLKESFKK